MAGNPASTLVVTNNYSVAITVNGQTIEANGGEYSFPFGQIAQVCADGYFRLMLLLGYFTAELNGFGLQFNGTQADALLADFLDGLAAETINFQS